MSDLAHELAVIDHMLDELGVTDDYLPPDILACGCEAEAGSMHLAWHLEERARLSPGARVGEADE